MFALRSRITMRSTVTNAPIFTGEVAALPDDLARAWPDEVTRPYCHLADMRSIAASGNFGSARRFLTVSTVCDRRNAVQRN